MEHVDEYCDRCGHDYSDHKEGFCHGEVGFLGENVCGPCEFLPEDPNMFVLEVEPQPVACPECGGQGGDYVTHDMATDAEDMSLVNQFIPCYRCGGDGWVLP